MQSKIVHFSTRTTNGSQSNTAVGFQPQAVIFMISNRPTADDAISAGAMLGIGFATSSSNEAAVAISDVDGQNPTVAKSYHTNARSFVQLNGSTVDIAAELTSFDANGFTLNYTNTNGTAYEVTALCICDIGNAYIKEFTTKTSTGEQAYTGVGFQPSGVIFISVNSGSAAPAVSANASLTISFISGAGQNASCTYLSLDGISGSDSYKGYGPSHSLMALDPADPSSFQTVANLSTLDPDGFTINYTTTNATARYVWALCVDGAGCKFFSDISLNVSGEKSTTGAGFEPQALMVIGINAPFGGSSSDATFCLGMTTSTAERSIGIASPSGYSPSSPRTVLGPRFYTHIDPFAFDQSVAGEWVSFDPDGYTLDWTNPSDDENLIMVLNFGAGDESSNRTGSGGARCAGSATVSKITTVIATGGARCAGTASVGRILSNIASGGDHCAGTASVGRIYPNTATGGVVCSGQGLQIHNTTGSGGARCAGSATVLKTVTLTALGGVVCAGTASVGRILSNTATGGVLVGGSGFLEGKIFTTSGTGGVVCSGRGLQTYSNTGSGGIRCAGSAIIQQLIFISGTGGDRTGGLAEVGGTIRISGSGGVVCSGTSLRSYHNTGSGGDVCSGTALRSYHNIGSGGVICSGKSFQTYNQTGSGGVLSSGTAAVVRICVPSVSGGAVCAGSQAITVFSSGGAVCAGTASVGRIYSNTATGGVVCAGKATFIFSNTASGGVRCSGRSVFSYSLTSQGGVVAGGSATETQFLIGKGGIRSGGLAVVEVIYDLTGRGGVRIAGTGSVSSSGGGGGSGGSGLFAFFAPIVSAVVGEEVTVDRMLFKYDDGTTFTNEEFVEPLPGDPAPYEHYKQHAIKSQRLRRFAQQNNITYFQ